MNKSIFSNCNDNGELCKNKHLSNSCCDNINKCICNRCSIGIIGPTGATGPTGTSGVLNFADFMH